MSDSITFRKATKEDLPRISEFRKALFYYADTRSHEAEYYHWKYFNNPMQEGELWIAEEGDKLVGIKGMTPKRIKILNELVSAAESGDGFIHPQYQGQGIIAELHNRSARAQGIHEMTIFVYGTPNDKSLKVAEKKLGATQIPIKLHYLLKPLKPLASRQPLKKKLHFSPLAVFAATVVEVISYIMFKLSMIETIKKNVIVSRESTFPPDIDILWQQCSQNYDVMITRTKEYLEWRYISNPDAYSVFIARGKNGAILGYMVTKIVPEGNGWTGYLIDFLTLENDRGVFKKLLGAALRHFSQNKVAMANTWVVKGNFYYRILQRSGFFPRNPVTVICYKSELDNKVLNSTFRWHFTIGDTDNI